MGALGIRAKTLMAFHNLSERESMPGTGEREREVKEVGS